MYISIYLYLYLTRYVDIYIYIPNVFYRQAPPGTQHEFVAAFSLRVGNH